MPRPIQKAVGEMRCPFESEHTAQVKWSDKTQNYFGYCPECKQTYGTRAGTAANNLVLKNMSLFDEQMTKAERPPVEDESVSPGAIDPEETPPEKKTEKPAKPEPGPKQKQEKEGGLWPFFN